MGDQIYIDIADYISGVIGRLGFDVQLTPVQVFFGFIIGIILLICCFAALHGAAVRKRAERFKSRDIKKTTGIVVNSWMEQEYYRNKNGEKKHRYAGYCDIRYDGNMWKRFRSGDRLEPGEQIIIYYDQGNPADCMTEEQLRLDSSSGWKDGLHFLGGFAVIVVIVLIIMHADGIF